MLSYRPFKSIHDFVVQALPPDPRRSPSDGSRYCGHQLSYALHDRIGIQATSLRQATPMARANLPDVVLTIYSHGELRPAVRDPPRIWQCADQVVKGGEPNRPWPDQERVVFRVRVGSSDDPVKGERVEKGPNVRIGVVGLIDQELSDGRSPWPSIPFVLAPGWHREGLACVLLVKSDQLSVLKSSSIVASHYDRGLTIKTTHRGLGHCQTKLLSQLQAEVLVDVESVEIPPRRGLEDVCRGSRARRDSPSFTIVDEGRLWLSARQTEMTTVSGQASCSVALNKIPQTLADRILREPLDRGWLINEAT